MTETGYTYRGIYDSGEIVRIQDLLDQQRSMFNASDAQSNSTLEKAKKYGIIAIGATVIVLTLKLIIK